MEMRDRLRLVEAAKVASPAKLQRAIGAVMQAEQKSTAAAVDATNDQPMGWYADGLDTAAQVLLETLTTT